MIIRKPYAFLIKHFKLIHIILTIIMFFFFIRMRNIAEFLKEYIDLGTYRKVNNVISEYIGIWGILLPIIIIGIIIVIMYLLIKKEKPVRYYIATIITYILEIITMIVAYSVLDSIEQGNVSATFIKIFKDFYSVMSYVPLIFMYTPFVRGIGFNIKQFNFQKDLVDLNIAASDNEEFELEVNVDTEDLKAKINRSIRFIKYLYLENKPVFFGVLIGVIISVIIIIYSHISNIEKIYKEKETFNSNGIIITVNESYKTDSSCDGKIIKKGSFYVIVKMNVKNTYQQIVELPYEHIYLRLAEYEKVSPIDNYQDELSDFGLRYISRNKLKELETREVVLVYEVKDEYKNNELRLEYYDSSIKTEAETKYNYMKVALNPKEFIKVETVSEKNLKDTISLDQSLLEGTKIKIEEAVIQKKFVYEYTKKINGVDKKFTKTVVPTDTSLYKKVVLRIKDEITKNEKLYSKVYSNFYGKFANIEYEVNGKVYRQKTNIINITPEDSEYTYLEIVEESLNADKVSLVFTVRDKEYKYLLITKEEK